MSGEWLKSTISDLITIYKNNENLYNPKHDLYYNKQARARSLFNILIAVRKSKPDATQKDVIKKIQILRTQFGQEINKIEKSKLLGEDLVYVPKVWWFEKLSFILEYMKFKSVSKPLSVKLEQSKEHNNAIVDNSEELYELVETNMDDELDAEFEEQTPKKRRIESTPNIINNSNVHSPNNTPRTIEYIINEETSEMGTSNQFNIITEASEIKGIDDRHLKRRSKMFGKYVGCLIRELNDDKFFEVQNDILKIIEKATSKKDKKN